MISKQMNKLTQKQTLKAKNWLKDIPLTSIGWDLAIPIFGGVFLGYQLDQALGLKYLFSLILLFLGVLTGYLNLYRVIELELLRSKSSQYEVPKEERFS